MELWYVNIPTGKAPKEWRLSRRGPILPKEEPKLSKWGPGGSLGPGSWSGSPSGCNGRWYYIQEGVSRREVMEITDEGCFDGNGLTEIWGRHFLDVRPDILLVFCLTTARAASNTALSWTGSPAGLNSAESVVIWVLWVLWRGILHSIEVKKNWKPVVSLYVTEGESQD